MNAGTKKNYWTTTIVAGLLTLATALWLSGQFPHDFAEPSADYRDPIMAFEFAETQADLLAIFGSASDPARTVRQAGMDQGHDGDWVFLIVYNIFIAAFFVDCYRESGQKLLFIGVLIAVTAALTDIWENAILRDLTYALDDPNLANALLAQLHSVTWLKWFALALGAGLASFALYTNRHKVLALLAVPAFVLALPAFLDPKAYATLFADMVGLWFIAMLIAAVLNQRRAAKSLQK